MPNEIHYGSVVWFRNDKGYGFVRPDKNDENNENVADQDIFVHFSNVRTEDKFEYKTLEKDERVSFRIKESPKGLEAVDVRRIRNTSVEQYVYPRI
jgi:CspA family cold shock protein